MGGSKQTLPVNGTLLHTCTCACFPPSVLLVDLMEGVRVDPRFTHSCSPLFPLDQVEAETEAVEWMSAITQARQRLVCSLAHYCPALHPPPSGTPPATPSSPSLLCIVR